jgi:hypothetical protein
LASWRSIPRDPALDGKIAEESAFLQAVWVDQSVVTVAQPFSCVLDVRWCRAFDILAEPQSAEADLMGEELWYVKVADDDVHRMTLDQLDGAFQAGHIDESTMVLAADATKWARLGELLGLDGAGEESEGPDGPPQPVEVVPAQGSRAYAAPVPVAAPAVVSAPARTVPMAAVASVAPAPAFMPNTLRPMSMDLEDGDLEAPFRRSSRKGWIVGVIGVAAIAGGVGFVATRARAGGSSNVTTAVAAPVVAPPPPPAVDPPAPPPPAPVTATNAKAPGAGPAEASPMNPHFTDRFNEDQKLKLLAADKEHEQKTKARHTGGGAGSHSAPKSKSTTFTTGGNKYDPLNSSI